MRILLLTAYYRPDGGAAAALFPLLCEALARRGHQVTALTTVPHYPSGSVPADYRGHHVRRSVENGVQVLRVPMPSVDRSKLAWRMLQFLTYQAQASLAGRNLAYDVALAHSPGLETWLPFTFYSTWRRRPAVYSVHDLYPEVGVRLGVFNHRPVAWMVEALEKSCLRGAACVRILSQSMRPGLRALGVPADKLRLIHDWVDPQEMRPQPRDNPFSQQHGLQDRFVILYAGNLGQVQGLETVVEAARLLACEPALHFVFVGDGAAKTSLIERAQSLGLENVTFLPYQPLERMPEVYASGDLCLVSLRQGAGFGALPSKVYAILACGRPLIASLDPGSEAWELVERSGAGTCVPPQSPEMLRDAILRLWKDAPACARMGANGRSYVMQHHSPDRAAETFERIFQEIQAARLPVLARS